MLLSPGWGQVGPLTLGLIFSGWMVGELALAQNSDQAPSSCMRTLEGTAPLQEGDLEPTIRELLAFIKGPMQDLSHHSNNETAWKEVIASELLLQKRRELEKKIGRIATKALMEEIQRRIEFLPETPKDEQTHTPPILPGESAVLPVFKPSKLSDLRAHHSPIHEARFSKNGNLFATAGADGSVKIWSTKTLTILFSLDEHVGEVMSVDFSPDGVLVATAGKDSKAYLWNAQTGQLLKTLSDHTNTIWSIRFSPDGSQLITASSDASAIVWDVKRGEKLFTLLAPKKSILSANFSKNGEFIITALVDGMINLWDAHNGRHLRFFSGHDGWVRTANFINKDKQILSASDDETAKVWDVATGENLLTIKERCFILSATCSNDGRYIVTTNSQRGIVKFWDSKNGDFQTEILGDPVQVNSADFSPDGHLLLTAGSDGSKIWTIFIDIALGDEVANGHR